MTNLQGKNRNKDLLQKLKKAKQNRYSYRTKKFHLIFPE